MSGIQATTANARPPRERRAFSLLELTTVVAIVGMVAGLAVMRFGHSGVETIDAEGIARKLAWTVHCARRQAISEGEPAAIVFTKSGSNVTSWQLARIDGGDQPVDDRVVVPGTLELQITDSRWQFDYTGQMTTPAAGASAYVTSDLWEWELTVYPTTGHVQITKAYDP
ncbi:MAG: pilus assembly FimT family protein [Lacipirellulaceae bacterium]